MPIIIILFIAYIGAQVPIMTSNPTHDDCRRVTVAFAYGFLKMFDGEVCGKEEVRLGVNSSEPFTNPK